VCKRRFALSFHCREELALHRPGRLAALASWHASSSFTPLQRSALAFVDQFVLDPSLIRLRNGVALDAEKLTLVDSDAAIEEFRPCT